MSLSTSAAHCAILIALCGQAAAAPLDAGAEVPYELARPMRVSLNVYDSKGEIVRSLLCGAPRKKGAQREFWDGLDQAGNPVPAGEYSWKLLAMPGRLKTEYLLTAATNYPDPVPDPMRELEHYRLVAPGTHGGPIAVAADESGVYIGASCTENIENYLVKISPDGSRRLWSKMQRVPWKGAVALAKSGEQLLVLSANNEIWPYAAEDGKDLPPIATSLPPADQSKPADKDKPADKEKPDDAGRHAAGLAANDREMVLCYPERGLVRWCDPTDGKLIREVAGLEKPTAVAITADSTTYCLCGTSILRLNQAGAAHATVVSGLGKPTRIAVNKAGELLVFDAATNQVLRFGTDGKRLAAFGQEGGRRNGTYDQAAQESFLDVGSVAAAPDGGFLVAEPNTAPRRVARFTADGRFDKEWYGGHVWAPWIAVDPENPGTVFMPSGWNSILRLAVDLEKKTWRVRAVYQLDRMADGMLQGQDNAALYRAFRRDGKLYLAKCSSNAQIFRVDDDGNHLTPVTGFHLQARHYEKQLRGPLKEWLEQGKQSYLWTDADGDGRPQRGEVQYSGPGPWNCLPHWDANGMYAVVGKAVQHWPINGVNSAGAPVLGDFPAGKPMLELPSRATKIESRWASYITADPVNGGWYLAINDTMTDWGRSTDSFLVAYSADGTRRWITGGKTIGSPQSHIAPGEIGCFRRIAGTTHDCVVINDFMEGPWPLTSYVWDRDGLWVGGVMDEIDRKAAPVWRYGAGGESLGTTLVNDPKTGDVLLYWHGLNDLRIGKVTGWEGWDRKSGKVKLAAAAAAKQPMLTEVPPGTGKGLQLEFWDQDHPADKPALVRLTDVNESWGQSRGPDKYRIFATGRVARVTGEIEAYQTGWHAFSTDNYPPKTQYRIAGVELGRYSFNEVFMEAGKRYPVEILYDAEMTHPTTNQGIRLKWATPRGTWPGGFTPIPASQLHAPAP